MLYLFYVFVMLNLFSLCLVRKHMFLIIIVLEFIVIFLLMFIYFFCLSYCYSFYIFMFMMVIYVCEGSLGLSLILCMIRCHSNDYINSMYLW